MRNTAISMFAAIAALFVFVSFSAPAFAQEDDMDLVPIPIDFEKLDLNGTWNFTTSQPTVSGGCPAGNAMAGTVAVTQQGNEVTFKYISGARCRPAEVCEYTGMVTAEIYSDDEGPGVRNEFLVSNTVDVDDEGGTVSSAILLIVFNNEFAKGEGVNNYVHPEGFECRWDMDVLLTREPEKKDKEEEVS